jgi:hypothetical protein
MLKLQCMQNKAAEVDQARQQQEQAQQQHTGDHAALMHARMCS